MNNKKKIIILSVIAVSAIVVSFIVFYKLKKIRLENLSNNQNNQAGNKEEAKYPPSVFNGSVEECEKEEDANKKNLCNYSLAISNNKSEFCDKILNNENLFKDCKDALKYNEIIKSGDIAKCKELPEKMVDKCYNEFFRSWGGLKDCADLKDELRVKCEDIMNHRKAFQEGNKKACNSIKNSDLKADCVNIAGNKAKDTDGDGIDNSDEKSYGTDSYKADTDSDGLDDYKELFVYLTDPRKADTDSDGFSDGDEVKNGYDPKSPRKSLNNITP